MGIPAIPLSDLYSAAGEYIRQRGGEVNLRASVESFKTDSEGVRLCIGGEELRSDFAVMAAPFNVIASLLPDDEASLPLRGMTAQLESSPITGIHLWFDRQITDLEHAVLLERTIQWMFHKSLLLDRHKQNGNSRPVGSYVELVVSASRSLVDLSKSEVVEIAVKELAEFFPDVKEAKLLKSAVIKEYFATYSIKPMSDRFRPDTVTAWPRVFLAGDWINTGWPATMEGAVRSGKIAAEAL